MEGKCFICIIGIANFNLVRRFSVVSIYIIWQPFLVPVINELTKLKNIEFYVNQSIKFILDMKVCRKLYMREAISFVRFKFFECNGFYTDCFHIPFVYTIKISGVIIAKSSIWKRP